MIAHLSSNCCSKIVGHVFPKTASPSAQIYLHPSVLKHLPQGHFWHLLCTCPAATLQQFQPRRAFYTWRLNRGSRGWILIGYKKAMFHQPPWKLKKKTNLLYLVKIHRLTPNSNHGFIVCRARAVGLPYISVEVMFRFPELVDFPTCHVTSPCAVTTVLCIVYYVCACRYHHVYHIHIPASSKGCCLNPKGWCIGTPYHPFSTPWKI